MKRILLILSGMALVFSLAGCLSLESQPTPIPVTAQVPKGAESPAAAEPADSVEVPPALRDRFPRNFEATQITTTGGFSWADPVEIPALNVSGETTRAYWEGEGANMALTLPEGWEYRLVSEKREATEDRDAYENFGILFRPTDRAGSVTLWYYPQGFGVCGTGLTAQRVTFASGLTAERGRWGGNWDYVYFLDTPGSGKYVARNDGLNGTRLDTAMEILGTAVLGDGISE